MDKETKLEIVALQNQLDELIEEQKRTNEILAQITEQIERTYDWLFIKL